MCCVTTIKFHSWHNNQSTFNRRRRVYEILIEYRVCNKVQVNDTTIIQTNKKNKNNKEKNNKNTQIQKKQQQQLLERNMHV